MLAIAAMALIAVVSVMVIALVLSQRAAEHEVKQKSQAVLDAKGITEGRNLYGFSPSSPYRASGSSYAINSNSNRLTLARISSWFNE